MCFLEAKRHRSAGLKCLFIVQGEGRGHLTQALTLRTLLDEEGHKVVHVMVGQSSQRETPSFFSQKIHSPTSHFESPNYIWDTEDKNLHLPLTFYINIKKLPQFIKSIHRIHKTIASTRPDVILNFFEPLVGIYALLYRPQIPIISVAHQYLFLHPRFCFPPGRRLAKMLAKTFTRITAIGARALLALSFYPLPDLPDKRLYIVPPLIRREVLGKRETKSDGYLLVYILNSGYGKEIISWHKKSREIEKHCFWDSKNAREKWSFDNYLTFHRIDDEKFLDMMYNCRAVITTAGFESICEACYLGKKVIAVPVGNHFDQLFNAYDVHINAGLGTSEKSFQNIDPLILDRSVDFQNYRQWVKQNGAKFVRQIANCL
jgi:uncharacterized protein (TIGR00661 family)